MPTFRRGTRGVPETLTEPIPEQRQHPPLDPFAGIPDRRYEISAAELLKPLIEPNSAGLLRLRKQSTSAPIVHLEDYYITGPLDLRAADLEYLLRFERCRFEYPPDVREANLLGLVFRKCWLPGLKARNMRSRTDVRLIHSVVEVEPAGADNVESTVRRSGNRERGMPDAAVNFTDAVIEGSVVLTRTKIHHPGAKAFQADRLQLTGAFLAYRLETQGEVRLPGMGAGGNVNFSGAVLHNPEGFALNCNGAQIGGSLLCEVDSYGPQEKRRGFSSNGVVYLPSARVNSDISFRGATLHTNQSGPIVLEAWRSSDRYLDPRPSLVADRIRVEGNLELSDGLQAVGTIRMINGRIGGSLRFARATVEVQRGNTSPFYDRALHLDGCVIDGDVEASGLRVTSGQSKLADITVGGNFVAGEAEFRHPDRDVFSARRAKISGNLHLADSIFQGTLRLQGVQVGGSVSLYGSNVSRPEITVQSSFSVDLRTANVGRDVIFTANQDSFFVAEGGINMDGATVTRRVNLGGAILNSFPRDRIALDASDVTADEFLLIPAKRPQGRIVLRRAHCGTLSDNSELWNATGGIELEDFRYDAMKIPIELKDDGTVDQRIRWLRSAMGRYRPGPYDQLAVMLRASGNEEHASTVLLRKQRFRYEALAKGYKFLGPGLKLWSWLQRAMFGYGYRPVRAVGWLLALLISGSLWFGFGADSCVNNSEVQHNGPRCVVNQDDSGLQWNPVLYTVDLLVPIVDFGNKGKWSMSGTDKWVSAGFTAMGWVLATTVAAGVSRTLRRGP